MTSSKRPSSSISAIQHASFVKIDTFPLTAKSPLLVAPQYLRLSRLLKPRQSVPQVCATMKLPSLHVTTTFHTSCMALSRSGPHCFEIIRSLFQYLLFRTSPLLLHPRRLRACRHAPCYDPVVFRHCFPPRDRVRLRPPFFILPSLYSTGT